MEQWLFFGTIGTVAISMMSIVMFFVTNNSAKILGKGLVRDLLLWMLIAEIFYLLMIGVDVVASIYEWPFFFAFKIFLQLMVPASLLYGMWMIKKYADKLKEMAA